jgi:hypothetical protein
MKPIDYYTETKILQERVCSLKAVKWADTSNVSIHKKNYLWTWECYYFKAQVPNMRCKFMCEVKFQEDRIP